MCMYMIISESPKFVVKFSFPGEIAWNQELLSPLFLRISHPTSQNKLIVPEN